MSKCHNCDNEACGNENYCRFGNKRNIPILCNRCNEILSIDITRDDASAIVDYIDACLSGGYNESRNIFRVAVVAAALEDEDGYFTQCVQELRNALKKSSLLKGLREASFGLFVEKFSAFKNSNYYSQKHFGKLAEFEKVSYRCQYDSVMETVFTASSQKPKEKEVLNDIGNDFRIMKEKLTRKIERQSAKERQKKAELAAAISVTSSQV